jgi:molecular chaperone DnaK (HSP70)
MRLGIDFGTTRTIVAVADRGNYPVVTFENAEGEFQEWYPSLVAVRGDERLYGFDALAKVTDSSWAIHRSFKRLLACVPNGGSVFGIPVSTLLSEYLKSLLATLQTRSNIDVEAPLEAVIGVPANSNSNQRFLTMEGFRLAGFDIVGVYDEPSAAGIEYAHRYRRSDITRKREHLLVYDLGGGTFDCSVIRMTGNDHSVVTSSGVARLGGDDFDAILLEMAQEHLDRDSDRLLELCRLAKERLNTNSRRILLTLGEREVTIPIEDFYKSCAPLIDRTVAVVESTLNKAGGEETVGCIYVVGGGSEFPPVARALRARFGRRVRKSAYSHASTAIGLAIAADAESEITLERTFTRNFGVWREIENGSVACFDRIFPKGSPIPSQVVRRYEPIHNIGHFRYLECDDIDDSSCPVGDITPWQDIRFPFEPRHRGNTASAPVDVLSGQPAHQVEEVYSCDENGIVQVTIRNLTAAYHYVYTLQSPADVRGREGTQRAQGSASIGS